MARIEICFHSDATRFDSIRFDSIFQHMNITDCYRIMQLKSQLTLTALILTEMPKDIFCSSMHELNLSRVATLFCMCAIFLFAILFFSLSSDIRFRIKRLLIDSHIRLERSEKKNKCYTRWEKKTTCSPIGLGVSKQYRLFQHGKH